MHSSINTQFLSADDGLNPRRFEAGGKQCLHMKYVHAIGFYYFATDK